MKRLFRSNQWDLYYTPAELYKDFGTIYHTRKFPYRVISPYNSNFKKIIKEIRRRSKHGEDKNKLVDKILNYYKSFLTEKELNIFKKYIVTRLQYKGFHLNNKEEKEILKSLNDKINFKIKETRYKRETYASLFLKKLEKNKKKKLNKREELKKKKEGLKKTEEYQKEEWRKNNIIKELSYKLFLNNANKNKLETLNSFYDEYIKITNFFIKRLWNVKNLYSKEINKLNLNNENITTWLSKRAIQSAKNLAIKFIKENREKNIKVIKKYNKSYIELDSRFISLNPNKNNNSKYKYLIKFSSLGQRKTLNIPIVAYPSFLNYLNDNKTQRKKVFKLFRKDNKLYVKITFIKVFAKIKPQEEHHNSFSVLFIHDNKIIVNDHIFCKKLKNLYKKLKNKKLESKNYERQKRNILNYLQYQAKEVFNTIKLNNHIIIENINKIRPNVKDVNIYINNVPYGFYKYFFDRVKKLLQQDDVHFVEVDPIKHIEKICPFCNKLFKDSLYKDKKTFICPSCKQRLLWRKYSNISNVFLSKYLINHYEIDKVKKIMLQIISTKRSTEEKTFFYQMFESYEKFLIKTPLKFDNKEFKRLEIESEEDSGLVLTSVNSTSTGVDVEVRSPRESGRFSESSKTINDQLNLSKLMLKLKKEFIKDYIDLEEENKNEEEKMEDYKLVPPKEEEIEELLKEIAQWEEEDKIFNRYFGEETTPEDEEIAKKQMEILEKEMQREDNRVEKNLQSIFNTTYLSEIIKEEMDEEDEEDEEDESFKFKSNCYDDDDYDYDDDDLDIGNINDLDSLFEREMKRQKKEEELIRKYNLEKLLDYMSTSSFDVSKFSFPDLEKKLENCFKNKKNF